VSSTPKRHVLCALLACGLANASTYAAFDGAAGGDSEQSNETTQRREPVVGPENPRRDTAGRNVASGHSEANARDSISRNSAVRSGPQAAMLQRSGIKPRGNAARLTGAPANVANSTAAVRRHPANPLDDATAAPRGVSAIAVQSAASRRFSGALPVADRRTPTLKAAAGNGVIGGPHDSARGVLGGAASGTRVTNRSIDGTAFRHRS
jgi:hypothetical protein